jgi:hypothetical protein
MQNSKESDRLKSGREERDDTGKNDEDQDKI